MARSRATESSLHGYITTMSDRWVGALNPPPWSNTGTHIISQEGVCDISALHCTLIRPCPRNKKGTSTHATRGSLRHVSETKRDLTFIARNGAGDTSALHCALSVLCLRSKTGSHTGMRGAPRQLARHADQGCSPQNVLTSNKPTDRKVWMASVNDGGCNGSISVGCLVDTLLG